MNPILLFSDGSTHPASRIGYGAYLALSELNFDLQTAAACVQLKRFKETNSTRLEIETLLWALRKTKPQAVTIYTDSQTIINLPARRRRLESYDYCSKAGMPLNNADLYQDFFALTDSIDCSFLKVKGHQKSQNKSKIDRIFTLVDRASRKALREDLAQ